MDNHPLHLWFLFPFVLFFLTPFLGCSKKQAPSTELIRSGNTTKDLYSDPTRDTGFEELDLSPSGESLQGVFVDNDMLLNRDSQLDDFSDPLHVIRPFAPVYFGFDQYNITKDERTKLIDIAEFIQSNPKARLLVEGYCDWKGTPAYNKSLGNRRATSVKSYLVDLGADGERIETVSIGDELAIPNADGERARLDRRATFIVSKGT
jgi:outer membrane protein OmpA-like peptidoglycan-associated protein